jgi:hypothetical protein
MAKLRLTQRMFRFILIVQGYHELCLKYQHLDERDPREIAKEFFMANASGAPLPENEATFEKVLKFNTKSIVDTLNAQLSLYTFK